jgi:predicted metal-dependent phosphotriesterase family hydrolase
MTGIRTVLGDIDTFDGVAYLHEHLIIDSPLIADRFPHIHLHDADAAVEEATYCRAAGVGLMVDAMPAAAGRDIVRLAAIAERADVAIVSATGLHHDRYYGPDHWSNHLDVEQLADLFIADLLTGVDEFDYTSPVVRRTQYRAGIAKVATSGRVPDSRDYRNLDAVAVASVATGAPVLTHCEGGYGGLAQVDRLVQAGVPAASIILSHVDKAHDFDYLIDLASTGALLEFDQALREHKVGVDSVTIQSILRLVGEGYDAQIVVGTDGARRSLWRSLGGQPGLAWLASSLPTLMRQAGVGEETLQKVLHDNAVRALTWRTVSNGAAHPRATDRVDLSGSSS